MLPPFMQEPDRPDNDAITANMRRIRGEFIRVLHTGGRFDGKNRQPSIAPVLMRNVMDMASQAGLSPEEALLILSYEALIKVEQMQDQLMEYHLLTPVPGLITRLR
jgi:hypothetical protein